MKDDSPSDSDFTILSNSIAPNSKTIKDGVTRIACFGLPGLINQTMNRKFRGITESGNLANNVPPSMKNSHKLFMDGLTLSYNLSARMIHTRSGNKSATACCAIGT